MKYELTFADHSENQDDCFISITTERMDFDSNEEAIDYMKGYNTNNLDKIVNLELAEEK